MAHRPDLARGMDLTHSRGSRSSSRNTDSHNRGKRESRGVHPNSSKGRTTTKPEQRCLRQIRRRRRGRGGNGDAKMGHGNGDGMMGF